MSLQKMKCPRSPDLTRQHKANFSSLCYDDFETQIFLKIPISRKGCSCVLTLPTSTHSAKSTNKPHTAGSPAHCCEPAWGQDCSCRGANYASKAKAQYNYWNIKVPIIKTALLRGQLISMSSKGEMKRVPGPMLPASTRLHRVSCGLPHPSPMHHEERLIPGVFCPTHRQPKPQTTAERMQG